MANEFVARNGLISQNNSTVTGSLQQGFSTIASGLYSHAEGNLTIASGSNSHTEGYLTTTTGSNSHAEGVQTITIGEGSHAEGSGTISFGEGSHAEGQITLTSGSYSHAEGINTQAIKNYSHAEGVNSIAIGVGSHAEGNTTQTGITTAFKTKQAITSGLVVFINGYGDISSYFTPGGYLYIYDAEFGNDIGWGAYQIDTVTGGTPTEIQLVDTGVNTSGLAYVGDITYLLNNGTFGGDQTIPGNYAHAEGIQTKAIGINSHAEGDQSQALGQQGHAEGEKSQAIGSNSHAEGYQSQAIGLYSHAEGSTTQAIGEGSHAEGTGTKVIGNYSHAEGAGTIAQGDYQHVQGQYNVTSSEQAAFILGNGIDDSNRSNLIYATGNNVQITGSLLVSGSITGSLFGTSSWSNNAISSSFASTASLAPAYLPIAVPQTTGLVISFTQDRVYGTFASPETGSAITSDTGSAILGVTNLIIHSASSAPTTGSDFKKLTGSSDYVAGLNYIYCTYIANNQIIYSISQAT